MTRQTLFATFFLAAIGLWGCQPKDQPTASQAAAPATSPIPAATQEPTAASTPAPTYSPAPTPPAAEPTPTPGGSPMPEEGLKTVSARDGDLWQANIDASSGKPVLTVTGHIVTRNPGVVLALERADATANPARLTLKLTLTQREGIWAQVMTNRSVMHICEDCSAVQSVMVVYPDGETVSVPINRL